MYHLLSVSSAMLISFLIGLLFAAMCAIVGRQKGYSTALCILLGFFGRLICLLILILLPDRMQEQYESDHLKQELSSLRQRMAELEQALEPTPAPEPAAPAADAQAAPPKRPPDAPAVSRRAIGIPATPVACRFNMNMNKYRRCRYVCCAEP